MQKGKGCTNITGEKLYEVQLLEAVEETSCSRGIQPVFYQCLADEHAQCYRLYRETEFPDVADVQAIADQTGGRYFRARDAKGLERIYEILDELEPVESDVEIIRPVDELFFWPMGLAYTLALLAALFTIRPFKSRVALS